jgi:energy-coupling factor transport system substrate-specific component
MDMEYVIGELKKGSGTQFDPTYTEILLELIEDGTINVEW